MRKLSDPVAARRRDRNSDAYNGPDKPVRPAIAPALSSELAQAFAALLKGLMARAARHDVQITKAAGHGVRPAERAARGLGLLLCLNRTRRARLLLLKANRLGILGHAFAQAIAALAAETHLSGHLRTAIGTGREALLRGGCLMVVCFIFDWLRW
jgi:hypothetical protein